MNDAPLKITINGQEEELAPEEAAELIQAGRQTREYETKYNTKLDKVWPEYGRTTQALKTTQEEKDAALQELQEYKEKVEKSTQTPADTKAAKDAAKDLGMTLQDLEKEGFIKKTDLESYLEKRDQERETQKRAVDQVLATADQLSKEIDGTDGRPAFHKKAVLAYASTYGFKDLTEAYEDMHKDKIDAWKEEKINAEKARSLNTLKPGGKKEPVTPRVTDGNFKVVLKEALKGTQE